jgi:hypothetical protein
MARAEATVLVAVTAGHGPAATPPVSAATTTSRPPPLPVVVVREVTVAGTDQVAVSLTFCTQ